MTATDGNEAKHAADSAAARRADNATGAASIGVSADRTNSAAGNLASDASGAAVGAAVSHAADHAAGDMARDAAGATGGEAAGEAAGAAADAPVKGRAARRASARAQAAKRGDDLPLMTLAVFAYRQEAFIRDAIEGAFAQDYPRLEIILSDDASPDGTFAVMQEMAAAYRGPHHIRLNRNTPNLGLIGHVNRIFEMARGALIVLNAGDDISEPERCAVLGARFADGRPMLIDSQLTTMTRDGRLGPVVSHQARVETYTSIEQVAGNLRSIQGASCAWNAEIYRVFGPITEPAAYEDMVLFFRASLLGRVAHVPRPLVRYREGGMSHSVDRLAHQSKLAAVREATLRQRIADTATFARWMRGLLGTRLREARVKSAAVARRIAASGEGRA